MKVTTIESNDSGVGFLVDVDGVTIFHAGDHASRRRDMSGPFKGKIDALVQKGARSDIAFLPVSGCNFGDQDAVKIGVEHILDTLKPKMLFPMHAGKYGTRYVEFIGAIQDRHTQTKMQAALCKGDHFSFRNGKAS